MKSKSYSASEIVALKQSHVPPEIVEKLREKLKEDSDLANIIRIGHPRPLPKVEEEHRQPFRNTRKKAVADRASAKQLDGTESEWKYKGRSDSEHTEREPITAPADHNTRQSEGFQRFYKTVVSPTHVRVTAGGRIVPNTRAPPMPTSYKWTRDRASGDASARSHSATANQFTANQFETMSGVAPFPMQQSHYGSYNPMMMNALGSNIHPAVFPGPTPMAFMPLPLGFNIPGGYAMPTPNLNHYVSPDLTCNGQLVMLHGNQLYPYNMVPAQGFHPIPMNSQLMMAPGNVVDHATHGMVVEKPTHTTSQQSGNVMGPVTNLETNTPISSIRPSKITRKQIETLRTSLRYFEDQLQYNKHQIDEKSTEDQARAIQTQIRHFEKILECQLAEERNNYPKYETRYGGERVQASKIENKSVNQETISDRASLRYAFEEPASKATNISRDRTRARVPTNLDPANPVATFPRMKDRINPVDCENIFPKKPSGLPVNAALAKPFQPRAALSTSSVVTAIMTPKPVATSLDPKETPLDVPNGSISAKGSSAWKSFFEKKRDKMRVGTPYLIGHLPEGIDHETARDSDYVYCRDLTNDEVRARHLFWGQAPHELLQGLPKFDGKDFYPASPPRHSTPRGSHELDPEIETASVSLYQQMTDHFQSMAISGLDAIRSPLGDVTKSESLPRDEDSILGNYGPGIPRPISCLTQSGEVFRSYSQPIKFRHDSSVIASNSTKANSKDTSKETSESKTLDNGSSASSGSSGSDKEDSLVFRGRQAMEQNRMVKRTRDNTILSSVLKKGKASVNAVPGKVSSTTAQGVLPHYSGHATASLSPAISNTATPLTRGQGGVKLADMRNTSRIIGNPIEKQVENRPPIDQRDTEQTHRGPIRQAKGPRPTGSR
ncbi:hypothetical protein BGZ63DRAFT_409079 [Mariannaea sp. PMI_226]|nr:hypothetical protein BGZ63DRAFT_409079 [Mariannaea sp. PMI_226]